MTDTGLTRPIPEEAMPALNLIRERVPRPKTLPVRFMITRGKWAFRFTMGSLPTKCCPLGLDETATAGAPEFMGQFSDDSPFCQIGSMPILKFGEWWDEQKYAQSAVDAVWGEQPCP